MKRNLFTTGLTAVLLSMLIAMAGIGCLTTAFAIAPADPGFIFLCCGLFAVVAAILFSFSWGILALTALSLVLILQTQWMVSLESVVYHITSFYQKAYGWEAVRWSSANLAGVAPDGALILVADCVIATVCWVVCRKKGFGIAVAAGLLPVAACCVITDAIPDSNLLMLLIIGLLLLILPHKVRLRSHKDANRLIALLLIPVMLFSGLIFSLAPDTEDPLYLESLTQDLRIFANWISGGILFPGVGPGIGPGRPIVSGFLDLSDVGPLHLGNDTVMEVTVRQTTGVFYLRGKAYDHYTGSRWESTMLTTYENGWPYDGLQVTDYITIRTPSALPLQYFSYYPTTNGWTSQLKNGALRNPEMLSEYNVRIANRKVIRDAKFKPLNATEQAAYLQLPEETLKRALEILKDLPIDESANAEQLASVIGNYVRSSAQYDTNTPAMPQGETDFALWFLEDSDTGYCTHFASAATVLLRAAGVPARYVTGYMTSVQAGTTCRVTGEQAHAWVEYLHPKFGWTMLEATPGEVAPPNTVPTEPTEPTDTTGPTDPSVTVPTDPTASTDTQPTTHPTGPDQTTTPESSDPTSPTQPSISDPPVQWNLTWLRYLLWGLGIWAILAGQYSLRRKYRKKWLRSGDPNRQALRRWRYVKLLARLTRQEKPDELYALAEKACFSQHTLTDEELSQFDGWLAQVCSRLLEKPWPLKLLIRLVFAI